MTQDDEKDIGNCFDEEMWEDHKPKITLDDLISSLPPLRLSNLFQLPGHSAPWQANLTDGIQYWDFGRGATPVQALTEAIAKAQGQGVGAIKGVKDPIGPEALGL